MSIKILITGPESSGKSFLATNLAIHFQAYLVNEFARNYLKSKNGYSQSDLTEIAIGQLQLEAEQKEKNAMIFCDTGVEVIHIWSQEKYGAIAPELQSLLNFNQYQLVLLCKPNIPWQPDPLREHPESRPYLFTKYEALLKQHKVSYHTIDETLENRLNQAIQLVQRNLMSQNQKP